MFGVPLFELIASRRISHREYMIWDRHFKDQWNDPSLTDHYLMQVAAYLGSDKDGRVPELDTMRIKFRWVTQAEAEGNGPVDEQHEANRVAVSKAATLAALGGKRKAEVPA